jgi:hypothetical protein
MMNNMNPVSVEKHRPEEAAARASMTVIGGGAAMPAMGCGILGKYPVLAILTFAVIGVGAGIGLSYWEPDDMEKKDNTLKWVRFFPNTRSMFP